MPRRSNLLQRTVKLIEESKGGFLSLEESALLIDKETGEKREVDIVLRGVLNSHPIIISFEVVDRARRAESGWVEQMLRKHQSLATDKLVLVSGSGFTQPARQKAEYNNTKIIDLSAGDKQLRIFLNRAAFIQGVTATVTCFVKTNEVFEMLKSDVEIQIGKLRQSAYEQSMILLRNSDIWKIFLNSAQEKEESYFKVFFPKPVMVYGRKEDTEERFDGIYFIVDVKRTRVPVHISSFDYDGVEYCYGTVGHSGSAREFVGSLYGEMWRVSEVGDDAG